CDVIDDEGHDRGLIVMPRCRSSAMESVWVLPSSTLPISSMTPTVKSSRSVRLVLPASTCARMPMFKEFGIFTMSPVTLGDALSRTLPGQLTAGDGLGFFAGPQPPHLLRRLEQLLERPLRFDAPILEHDDLVRARERRAAVRHGQNCELRI